LVGAPAPRQADGRLLVQAEPGIAERRLARAAAIARAAVAGQAHDDGLAPAGRRHAGSDVLDHAAGLVPEDRRKRAAPGPLGPRSAHPRRDVRGPRSAWEGIDVDAPDDVVARGLEDGVREPAPRGEVALVAAEVLEVLVEAHLARPIASPETGRRPDVVHR